MNYLLVREEAIAATRTLVRSFPNEDRAYAQLGHVLATSSEAQDEAARRQLETCIELNPSNTYCREYLARLSLR